MIEINGYILIKLEDLSRKLLDLFKVISIFSIGYNRLCNVFVYSK